jgi:hypothetical protein
MPLRLQRFSLVLVLALCLGLLASCGNYMKLSGKITRVRVVETGGPRNVLVVEFEATNTAKVGYVFREAEVILTRGDRVITGDAIAVRDAASMCQHMASLGGDCAEPLLTRQTFAPGETVTRLVAASFQLSADELRERDKLVLRVIELDRLPTEFVEAP